MTYVRFALTPSDIGYRGPINAEFVMMASERIRNNLQQLVESHDDSVTRAHDSRRTHDPIKSSSWMIKYQGNEILITNQIGSPINNIRTLSEGNGDGPICAKHTTRRVRKGWGDQWIKSKERYSEKDGHKDKPAPGSLGPAYPGMLRFYSKRDGMWVYRHCVKPISSAVITDFNRDIRKAVLDGLESTYLEQFDFAEQDSVGTNQPIEDMDEAITLEEMTKLNESAISTTRIVDEFIEDKTEDTPPGPVQQPVDMEAEKVHHKFGLAQRVFSGVADVEKKAVKAAKSFLGRFGL